MAPKKRPVPKTTASAKANKADAPGSPSADSPGASGKNSTPLLERLKMRSAGNAVDLNMSSQSVLRDSLSPLPKKVRAEQESKGDESSTAPRLSVDHENSVSQKDRDADFEALHLEIAKLQEAESQVRSQFEQEAVARKKVEKELNQELARREELERASSDRKSGGRKSTREEASAARKIAQLEKALDDAEKSREKLEEEVARITEEKETLENQYDDALNNTLMSFKSPGPRMGVRSARKSTGRLSLSGYADEFANMAANSTDFDAVNKRVAELEHIIERQADEIDKYIKKGSADDCYDMEGLDQRFAQLQEQLDSERTEATRFREESSRLSAQVDFLTSENGVLVTRIRNYQEEELAYEATSAEVESLQSETLTMRSEIETQKKRIFNADQVIDQLTRQLETSKNHIFTIEDQLKVLERDLEASKFSYNALEQVSNRKQTVLNTELTNLRTEIRKLRDECGETKTLYHKSKQEIIDLNTNGQRWQTRANDYEMKFQTAETEAKRSKNELEAIRRESAVSVRNFELREQEMISTLSDNQAELGTLSVEFRNVKLERDHLVNQVRNISDQLHEMKQNNEHVLKATVNKHEAEMEALRQNKAELEALLQSVRREKSHYENQCKVSQKEESNAIAAAQGRVKELEQTVEAQKKLNARLQRENSQVEFVPPEQTMAASLGKGISVLGSPPPLQVARELQPHVSVPQTQVPPARELQAHASVPQTEISAHRELQAHASVPVASHSSVPIAAPSPARTAESSNPLAFWKAKIAQNRPPAPPVNARTPIAARTPQHQQPAVQQTVAPQPFFSQSPAVVVNRRISRVEAVQKEFEMEDNLSPILTAVNEIDMHDETENIMEKENDSTAYMRVWTTALANRPAEWQNAISRVPGGSDSFQFGSKQIQCRLVGSDMLVIDGKVQMLVDKFLDKMGDACVNGTSEAAPVAALAEVKKGGLRFKNLRKQPLGQTNETE